MKKIHFGLKKSALTLILQAWLILSLSSTMVFAQSPEASPSPPVESSPTPTPSPTLSTVAPSVAASPSSPTPAIITDIPIVPTWTTPALSTSTPPVDLANIVNQVLPSIVSINVEVTSTDPFGAPTLQQGAGSGWVIDPNGLIVTNNHVVSGAQNINISFSDGTNYPAQQVAMDPITDLAVIKAENGRCDCQH